MKIFTYYNGPIVFPGRTVPYRTSWGKRHIFYVYYCQNHECLHRVYKTWKYCPYCGTKIGWEEIL